ncbi:metal-dependent transcriptional regulator [Levilactobacillus huananensis]|uniref:metal-dependent transcriptional regulator n=1 Tax=Levilactobacillus huananensis TaxID=2486019 RepID=UPI000F7A74E8|nr:metal-dependent transcriptional regulator [Levilactobacillus huananensis]
MLRQQNKYLRIIAECNFARPRVSNKQVIRFAQVSPASVTEMTRHLQRAGWVHRRRYTGVTLTTKGRHLAGKLLIRYRLCEVFLAQQLNLPLPLIPKQAWAMSATLTPETTTALATFLDHPQTSPFGGSLNPTEVLNDSQMTRLSEVNPDTTVVFHHYLETPDMITYLEHLALPLGQPIHLIKQDPALNLLYIDWPDHPAISLDLAAADYIYTQVPAD